MSLLHRCESCRHRPGPRRISFGKTGAQKKATCICDCHEVEHGVSRKKHNS